MAAITGYAGGLPPFDGDRSGQAPVAVHVMTGLVVVADWIASSDVFLRERVTWLQGCPARVDAEWVHLAWTAARDTAHQVLPIMGLQQPPLPDVTGYGFSSVFPGFEPRGVQVPLVGEELPSDAGLVIITAPTGEGKTEAAWWVAHQLAARHGATGVTFALPTMATTDAMHDRTRAHLSKVAGLTGVDVPVSLVHGLASLTRDTHTGPAGSEDTLAVAGWLRGNRKGMLAATTVCTIDQVLAAALRARFGMLRMTGLANRVLIIDEAHAYDAGMQVLLQRALTWLAAYRVPVVVLSATLNADLARALMDAYARGTTRTTEMDADAVPVPGYPSITMFSPTAGWRSRPVETARAWQVQVELHEHGHTWDGNAMVPAVRARTGPLEAGERGVVGVMVNQVRHAQNLYVATCEWAVDAGVEVVLLHSRLPIGVRRERTRRVLQMAGPPGRGERPARAVIIGTQVLEQSLDIDLDLLITALAPMSQLLQRAGRLWRHPRGERPEWLGEYAPLHVLIPHTHDGTVAKGAALPYDPAVLNMTEHALRNHLTQRGSLIAVPGDIQDLVDQVHTLKLLHTPGDDDTDLDLFVQEWLAQGVAGDTAKEGAMTASVIPYPNDVSLTSMHQLTSTSDPETDLRTRLGGDSGYVLPVDSDGYAIAATGERIPLPGPDPWGRVPVEQARAVLDLCIPVNDRPLLEEVSPHEDWALDPVLARVGLLPIDSRREFPMPPSHPRGAARVGRFDPDLGLCW